MLLFQDAAADAMTVDSKEEDKIFQKLATFVLGCFTIAHSTAAVERTFSIVNCVKSKVRNRMIISTLEAILRLKLQPYFNYFKQFNISYLKIISSIKQWAVLQDNLSIFFFIRVRTYLSNRGKCCKTLEPSVAMLGLFTSQINSSTKPALTQAGVYNFLQKSSNSKFLPPFLKM